MKDLFITYEIALKLKDLGFNEPCIARYNKGKFEYNRLGNWYKHNSGEIEKHYISAPLYQQVLKWLREVYKIDLYVCPIKDCTKNPVKDWTEDPIGIKKYYWCIYEHESEIINAETLIMYDTYERALEVGLQEALKLI